jgi:hypothetical protein
MGTLQPVPGIRGRAAEIAVLGESLDRVTSGRLAVVLIQGEAGIGKTRLLDEALAGARERGMQVAAGRAQELEQNRPFGLAAGAFGARRRRRIRGGRPSPGCWRAGAPVPGIRSR